MVDSRRGPIICAPVRATLAMDRVAAAIDRGMNYSFLPI